MEVSNRAEGQLQGLRDYIGDLERERDYFKGEYQSVYDDIGALGEALGHPRMARPQSPATLMRMWIDEVRDIVDGASG